MIAMATFLLFAQTSGTIAGTVSDALTHRPVRRALVTAVNGPRDVTGEDGTYILHGLPSGDLRLHIAVPGYSDLDTTARFAETDFLKQDFEVHPLASISGKLLDKDTGEPIVRLISLERAGKGVFGSGGQKSEEKSGAFAIVNLEPGDYTLKLRDADDIAFSFGSGKSDPKKPHRAYGAAVYPSTIHLSEGERQTLDVRFPAIEAHAVMGTVELPEGHAAEEMSLTLWNPGDPLPRTARANGSSAFRIEGLTRGEYQLIAELGKGVAFGRVSFNITDHDIDVPLLKLSPSASLTGTVRMAEEDAPLPPKLGVWLDSTSQWGSCATMCFFVPVPGLLPVALLQRPGLVATFHEPTPVQDGRFRADGIAPGDYWPELFGAGFPEVHGLPDGYAVLGGDDQPVSIYGSTEVTFVVTSKPGAITGTVRDKDQYPVAKSVVTLMPAGDPRRRRSTESGAAGEFSFRNVAPGKYLVNGAPVEVGFSQTATVTVPAGAP